MTSRQLLVDQLIKAFRLLPGEQNQQTIGFSETIISIMDFNYRFASIFGRFLNERIKYGLGHFRSSVSKSQRTKEYETSCLLFSISATRKAMWK